MDLVIKNGTIVTASDIYRADLGIREGKVALIGRDIYADEVIDASGKYVFPGFVDPHVHLQMTIGEITSTDDFVTGTIAAACGGTTTIIDFVDPKPGESLQEAARKRREQADGRVAIDYGLHLTATNALPQTLAELPILAEEGYTSLKLYTTYPALMVEDGELLRLLKAAKSFGILPVVHTENHQAVEFLKQELLDEGKIEPRYHPRSRPPLVEAEAANRVLALAGLVDCPVYIAHLTCLETLEIVEIARRRGQEVYVEVTPNHLLLSEEEYERPGFEGAKFILSPPLRGKRNLDALWLGLADGRVQVVSTDHCPWNFAVEKQLGRGDFTKIPGGMPGIETRIALLFSEGVGKGRISLNRFVDVCSTLPAKLFGLYPRKGTIVIGSDADIVIFDPDKEVTLSCKDLHQNVDYCPFEGWRVRGYPDIVIAKGKVIFREGEFVGEVGAGEFLERI
jgi:dihydropyrimidinase